MKLWDLETRDCVLTMDVMWASQHSGSNSSSSSPWSFDSLKMNFFEPSSDYIGALQFWNFALASGTTDGKLRMWDCKLDNLCQSWRTCLTICFIDIILVRTGQAHRTLPGHKGKQNENRGQHLYFHTHSLSFSFFLRLLLTIIGAITALQFDEIHLVSGSADKTIRVSNKTLIMVMDVWFIQSHCLCTWLGLGFTNWIRNWYIDLCRAAVQHAIQLRKNHQRNQYQWYRCKFHLQSNYVMYTLVLFYWSSIFVQHYFFPLDIQPNILPT